MPPSLGVNLRVTGHCNQGGRKYMEDVFSVAYQQTNDEKDLEYAFFGIFDGHGGREAAQFAKDHLMDAITKNKLFWSEDDDLVLKAIREGFLSTQQSMWTELPNWRKTATGLPSTAGTTASICFIKRGKLFIGHVGDSGIVLGERDPTHPSRWRAKPLTREHKPESKIELDRIEAAGGKVLSKSGVPRVVWYRPSNGAKHQGPVRRSTHFDEVPFLAVARALGDLWSYNSKQDVFVVSPDPDLHVFDLNVLKDRCLVLATDGAWNVLSPEMAVEEVFTAERNNEKHMINPQGGHTWVNPSKRLVDLALDRWNSFRLRADNTSIVTVMLDPPGPPRAQVLRRLYGLQSPKPQNHLKTTVLNNPQPSESVQECLSKQTSVQPDQCDVVHGTDLKKNEDNIGHDTEKENEISSPVKTKTYKSQYRNQEEAGSIAIISRFPNSKRDEEQEGKNLVNVEGVQSGTASSTTNSTATRIVHDSIKNVPLKMRVSPQKVPAYNIHPAHPSKTAQVSTSSTINAIPIKQHPKGPNSHTKEAEVKVEEQISSSTSKNKCAQVHSCIEESGIRHIVPPISSPLQINQVTSSDDEKTPPPVPQRPPGGYRSANKRRSLCRELADLQVNASSMVSGAGDAKRKPAFVQAKVLSGSSDMARSTRSRHDGNVIDPKLIPQKHLPLQSSNALENTAMPSSQGCVSRKPPRRSILMPGDWSDSPNYNSDSENHQPPALQLRSQPRRSLSVPLSKGSSSNENSGARAASAGSVKGKNMGTCAGPGPSIPNKSKVPSSNLVANKVKQMAVTIDNRNAQSPHQHPPPLPSRNIPRSAPSQHKVLNTNTPNLGKTTLVSKSPAAKPTNSLTNGDSISPRVLRPRNAPSTTSIGQHSKSLHNSRMISTPNNRITSANDIGKNTSSKITARSVRFFEEQCLNKCTETGVKRKRRSFDASAGSSVPIKKSAKLIRSARSCTWNNQNLCNKDNSQVSNTLSSKKQQLSSNIVTYSPNRRVLKNL